MKVLDSYGIFESLGYTRRNRSVLEETDQIIHAGRDAGKEHIQKRDGSHGFYDYNRSGNDHRIMASFDPDTDIFILFVYGILFHRDGRSGLDGSAENDIAAVADAAKDSAGMIGKLLKRTVRSIGIRVIILTSAGSGCCKTVTDLKTFDGADGKDRFSEIGIQFFKSRITNAGFQ